MSEVEQRQLHVLAVDDSSVDRAIISKILRCSKYKVTAVDSAARALELLDRGLDVNMIITDYWMPEMTGYDLLKKLKETSSLREIPVVVMSSEKRPKSNQQVSGGGSGGFLAEAC